PTAWLIEVAKNRAVDVLRREKRFDSSSERKAEDAIVEAMSPEADGENQLSMMFAICDDGLSVETHVTVTLRLLCGFSPVEIAHAFLIDPSVIERRLHRGRQRLRELGAIRDIALEHTIAPSVEATRWEKIVAYYDALMTVSPGPVVALSRGLALAELRGL